MVRLLCVEEAANLLLKMMAERAANKREARVLNMATTQHTCLEQQNLQAATELGHHQLSPL